MSICKSNIVSEYVSVVTLNFKNVLCSYRGIKNTANSKFAIIINFRIWPNRG